jgi:hypothetical protein
MDDIESMCRGFLQNAAARKWAVAKVAPEAPTADYLTGFGDGYEAGHVAALALVVGMLSGESMLGLIEEADAQAAIESTFPFDMIIIDADPAEFDTTELDFGESAPPKAA